MRIVDLTGHVYGRLRPLRRAATGIRRVAWVCACECGNDVDPTISSRNQITYSYRRNAKARNFVWDLDEAALLSLLTGHCHYCGVAPRQVRVGRGGSGKPMPGFTYNGIDRVDNTAGYTVDNCVSCCGICNHAKATLPYEAFITWLDRICAFRSER